MMKKVASIVLAMMIATSVTAFASADTPSTWTQASVDELKGYNDLGPQSANVGQAVSETEIDGIDFSKGQPLLAETYYHDIDLREIASVQELVDKYEDIDKTRKNIYVEARNIKYYVNDISEYGNSYPDVEIRLILRGGGTAYMFACNPIDDSNLAIFNLAKDINRDFSKLVFRDEANVEESINAYLEEVEADFKPNIGTKYEKWLGSRWEHDKTFFTESLQIKYCHRYDSSFQLGITYNQKVLFPDKKPSELAFMDVNLKYDSRYVEKMDECISIIGGEAEYEMWNSGPVYYPYGWGVGNSRIYTSVEGDGQGGGTADIEYGIRKNKYQYSDDVNFFIASTFDALFPESANIDEVYNKIFTDIEGTKIQDQFGEFYRVSTLSGTSFELNGFTVEYLQSTYFIVNIKY